MPDLTNLDPGLYELLITTGLTEALDAGSPAQHDSTIAPVDVVDAPHVLTQHLSGVIARALQTMPAEEQIVTANRVLQAFPTRRARKLSKQVHDS